MNPSAFFRRRARVFAAGLAMVAALSGGAALAGTGTRPAVPFSLELMVYGTPDYLGTVDATTTSKTNAQASSTFATSGTLLKGKVLLINNSGSVDIRILAVTNSTDTVSNTRGSTFGPPIHPGDTVIVTMPNDRGYLAVIATSSTANVDVWELK